MICPTCDTYTEVLETRVNPDGMRRRYECANMHRFTTQEALVPQKKYRRNSASNTRRKRMPNFSAWDRQLLDKFATEAYLRLRAQEEALEQFRGDLKDAMKLLRIQQVLGDAVSPPTAK